jgi:hypothetical protein
VTGVNDPVHWLEKARSLAQQTGDRVSKLAMLDIASEYEKLAQRAELRSERRLPRTT